MHECFAVIRTRISVVLISCVQFLTVVELETNQMAERSPQKRKEAPPLSSEKAPPSSPTKPPSPPLLASVDDAVSSSRRRWSDQKYILVVLLLMAVSFHLGSSLNNSALCAASQAQRDANVVFRPTANFTSRNDSTTHQNEEVETNMTATAVSLFDNLLPKNITDQPCSLDLLFHDNCVGRARAEVCVFPTFILKRVPPNHTDSWELETKMFEVLNDTRFFPKLISRDDNCRTIVIENVRTPGQTKNQWSANFTYYRDFFVSLFDIFDANNIYPRDLNTCCNTIANGEAIRIIDFNKYISNSDRTTLPQRNRELRDTMLDEIRNATIRHWEKNHHR